MTEEAVSPRPHSRPSVNAFVDRSRKSGVSFATRGDLIVIAPPLVIEEDDLTDGLCLMERTHEGLEWS
jgi:taurine--2-oxoglutarate transaminase